MGPSQSKNQDLCRGSLKLPGIARNLKYLVFSHLTQDNSNLPEINGSQASEVMIPEQSY